MSESHDPTTATPLPDCSVKTHNPETTWRTTPVSDGLLAFFDPCRFCFPDGTVDVDIVVRSGCHGNSLHRPNTAGPEEVTVNE
ncbi:hypothetical protein [Haladaptatus sp. NG-SE-30]